MDNTIEAREVMINEEALEVINRDLVSLVTTIKDLVGQLEPQVKAIAKEVQPITNVIKTNLDRDETLVLVERLTSNTGMLLEVMSLLEGLNDLRAQIEPQLKLLAKETSPVLNSIKASIDREETMVLLERLSANTGTLLEAVGYLEALKDLTGQLEPQLKSLTKELGPSVNRIKANIDRDETLLLIEKATSSTGTFLELMSYMEAFVDLWKHFEPQLKHITKELSPGITTFRSFLESEKTQEFAKRGFNAMQGFVEDDEMLDLVNRMPSLKKPLVSFMDSLCTKTGECDGEETTVLHSCIQSLSKLTEVASSPVIQNILDTTSSTFQDMKVADVQPASPLKLMSALRDKDVQRATGFLIFFLKRLGQGLDSNGSASPQAVEHNTDG